MKTNSAISSAAASYDKVDEGKDLAKWQLSADTKAVLSLAAFRFKK